MPTFNAKVVKYNNDLQGTVIIDGKEYSFDNLVKDEQVEIEMSKDKSRVTVKRICSSSPNRVKPNCGIYDKCGGCSLQHVNYEATRDIKRDILMESITRYTKINPRNR